MMSYLAFKSLEIGGGVRSPVHALAWKRQQGDAAVIADSPAGPGIHAATYHIASEYLYYPNCRLFLVAPHPDAEVELCEAGWRATAAVLVAPFVNFAQAARLILAGHQAGYPQLKAILDWARAFAQRPPWTEAKVRRILAHHAPNLDMANVGGKWLVYDRQTGLAHGGRTCGTSPKDVLATVLEYHEAVALGVIEKEIP